MPKSQSAVPDATSRVCNLSTGVSRPDKSHYGIQEYLGEAKNVALACPSHEAKTTALLRGRAGSSLAVALPD